VPDRYSVLLPVITDASYRRTLGGLTSVAQDARVFLSELAPRLAPPLPPTYVPQCPARRTRTSSIK
jgi:hypothetical protein